MENVLLIVLTSIAGSVCIYIFLRRKIDQLLDSRKIVNRITSEISQLIVELNQTTDRNIELIEERISSLEGLLKKADNRLRLLDRETSKDDRVKDVYNHIRPKVLNPSKERKVPLAEDMPSVVPVKKTVQDEVLELFNMGIDPKIIAGRVGKTLGEIELIISLSGRK